MIRFVFVSEDYLTETPKFSIAPLISPRLYLYSTLLDDSFFHLYLLQNKNGIKRCHRKEHVSEKIDSAEIFAVNLFIFFYKSILNEFQFIVALKIGFPFVNEIKEFEEFTENNDPYFFVWTHQSEDVN